MRTKILRETKVAIVYKMIEIWPSDWQSENIYEHLDL